MAADCNRSAGLFDVRVKLAVYELFAERSRRPSPVEVAGRLNADVSEVLAAYKRLQAQRVLLLEPDGASIRMAPPFSGLPTQHQVRIANQTYSANCAWDALGIPAAMHESALVSSRCEQTREPLRLEVGPCGPAQTQWLFHCEVPAAHWWRDLVYT
jgi:hypothetical protein